MEQAELKQHKKFLKEAVKMAEKGMLEGKGGPFGAVIVQNGKIIARGCNQVTSSNDPTRHAEVDAIRKACKNWGRLNSGTVLSIHPASRARCAWAPFTGRARKRYFSRRTVLPRPNTALTTNLFIKKSLCRWKTLAADVLH